MQGPVSWLQCHQSIVTHTLLALLNLPLVELSFSINLAQVSCMFLKQLTLFLQGQICAPVNIGGVQQKSVTGLAPTVT